MGNLVKKALEILKYAHRSKNVFLKSPCKEEGSHESKAAVHIREQSVLSYLIFKNTWRVISELK